MYPETTSYHVTGVDCDGRRFKLVTTNRMYAFSINVWQGTIWEVMPKGSKRRRKLLRRIIN